MLLEYLFNRKDDNFLIDLNRYRITW